MLVFFFFDSSGDPLFWMFGSALLFSLVYLRDDDWMLDGGGGLSSEARQRIGSEFGIAGGWG